MCHVTSPHCHGREPTRVLVAVIQTLPSAPPRDQSRSPGFHPYRSRPASYVPYALTLFSAICTNPLECHMHSPPLCSPPSTPPSPTRADSTWHHIAVSWDQASGEVSCYLDGEPKVAFWRNSRGVVQVEGGEEGVILHRRGRGGRYNWVEVCVGSRKWLSGATSGGGRVRVSKGRR